jgi:hypothetical protein
MHAEVKILERARVRKQRCLPLPGEVLVQPGARVEPDTIVARTDLLPGAPYILDVARELKLPRDRIPGDLMDKAMVVGVGDEVKTGDLIARYASGFFTEVRTVKSPVDGMVEFVSRLQHSVLIRERSRSAKPVVVVPVAQTIDVWPRMLRMYTQVREGDEVQQGQILAAAPSALGFDYAYSPIAGVVEKICTRTGSVTIVRPARPTQVDAYIRGGVTATMPGDGAEVTTAAAYIEGVFGVGGEAYGPLVVVAAPGETVGAGAITSVHQGCVLAGGCLVTLDALRQCLETGVRGLVTGGVNNLDLVRFLGRELTVGLTGQEELPFTLVLTEGFGSMPMSRRAYDLLRTHEGTVVSINGRTQIRAGAVRPEVVIPLDLEVDPLLPEAGLELVPGAGRPGPGVLVRIARGPYFGQWGRAVEVLDQPVKVESELSLYAVRVELEAGGTVTVAESNLEVWA